MTLAIMNLHFCLSFDKCNRQVCGENDCANMAKVEAMDVIWKKAGDNPILLRPLDSPLFRYDILYVRFSQFSQISS